MREVDVTGRHRLGGRSSGWSWSVRPGSQLVRLLVLQHQEFCDHPSQLLGVLRGPTTLPGLSHENAAL